MRNSQCVDLGTNNVMSGKKIFIIVEFDVIKNY